MDGLNLAASGKLSEKLLEAVTVLGQGILIMGKEMKEAREAKEKEAAEKKEAEKKEAEKKEAEKEAEKKEAEKKKQASIKEKGRQNDVFSDDAFAVILQEEEPRSQQIHEDSLLAQKLQSAWENEDKFQAVDKSSSRQEAKTECPTVATRGSGEQEREVSQCRRTTREAEGSRGHNSGRLANGVAVAHSYCDICKVYTYRETYWNCRECGDYRYRTWWNNW